MPVFCVYNRRQQWALSGKSTARMQKRAVGKAESRGSRKAREKDNREPSAPELSKVRRMPALAA